MFSPHAYELLDFGHGRKLERFGGLLVDRPSPSAHGEVADAPLWQGALRFDRESASWSTPQAPAGWHMEYGSLQFELAPTDSGQVGVFPEQVVNWRWIVERVQRRSAPRVLNLFAYTGGSTLAAAAAGAEVVHIDASKSAVHWARRNARRSQLEGAPIRWIVEDVPKFVRREVKRGNQYDGIILDPPSYGHGPKGEEWKLSRDLVHLLTSCKELLSATPALFLVSCHTSGFEAAELSSALTSCLFGSCAADVNTRELALSTADGRRLSAGYAAFWP